MLTDGFMGKQTNHIILHLLNYIYFGKNNHLAALEVLNC